MIIGFEKNTVTLRTVSAARRGAAAIPFEFEGKEMAFLPDSHQRDLTYRDNRRYRVPGVVYELRDRPGTQQRAILMIAANGPASSEYAQLFTEEKGVRVDVHTLVRISTINTCLHQGEGVYVETAQGNYQFYPDGNLADVRFNGPREYVIPGKVLNSLLEQESEQRATLIIAATGWRDTQQCQLVLVDD